MTSRRRTLIWLLAGAGASVGVAACGKRAPAFDSLDITGAKGFDTAFSLADTDGHMRSLADYRGKVVVLFFGFTQCPDICPTSLAELAQARTRLGESGKQLQVIFVTVDPVRDTAPILKQYTAAFDPTFIALRPADDATVAALTKAFHIHVAKVPDSGAASGVVANGGYTIEHTAASFVFDPKGTLRLFARDGEGVDRWVHDIPLLLKT